MRFKSRHPQQRNTVLLAGWLFADLFLALFVIFLSANTGGINLQPVPTPTPTQIPTPTTATPPPLELTYRPILLTNIDTDGLLNNTQSAIDDLKQRIRSQRFLSGRTVGLVLVYAGALDVTRTPRAYAVSDKVMDVLRSLGKEGFAFTLTSYYDHLYKLYEDEHTILIHLYLFV